jgi:hypothetical protein
MIAQMMPAEVNAEAGKQPRRHERAGNARGKVGEQAEPGPEHDMAGQPTGDDADQQDDEDALGREIHECATDLPRGMFRLSAEFGLRLRHDPGTPERQPDQKGGEDRHVGQVPGLQDLLGIGQAHDRGGLSLVVEDERHDLFAARDGV